MATSAISHDTHSSVKDLLHLSLLSIHSPPPNRIRKSHPQNYSIRFESQSINDPSPSLAPHLVIGLACSHSPSPRSHLPDLCPTPTSSSNQQ